MLRETKFHLLVGQTAILSQDWESAEMSLQLAVDMSGSVKLALVVPRNNTAIL